MAAKELKAISKNNKAHGLQTVWFPAGEIKTQSQFSHGSKVNVQSKKTSTRDLASVKKK